jgi:glycosyltransferase involved in cell wall biosynthesis
MRNNSATCRSRVDAAREPSRPAFSILIPSFNQGRFIAAAIDSVLAQRDASVEAIVIDGGSTDDTVDVLHGYGDRLAYWVSERDNGQAHALNKALARARGRIVGWLNSDDLYLPGAFAAVERAFARDPEAAVVHGDHLMLEASGQVIGWSCVRTFSPANDHYVVYSDAAFWRRDHPAIRGARFREDLQFAMDVDWFLGIHARAGRFVHAGRMLSAVRYHEAAKTARIPHVGRAEGHEVWRRAFGRLPTRPAPPPPWTHLLAPLLYPRLLALPYLSYRWRRTR